MWNCTLFFIFMPPKKQRLISVHKDLFCSCYIVLDDIKTFLSHVRSIQDSRLHWKVFLKSYEIIPLSVCETSTIQLVLDIIIYFHAAQDTKIKIQIIVSRSKIPAIKRSFMRYNTFSRNRKDSMQIKLPRNRGDIWEKVRKSLSANRHSRDALSVQKNANVHDICHWTNDNVTCKLSLLRMSQDFIIENFALTRVSYPMYNSHRWRYWFCSWPGNNVRNLLALSIKPFFFVLYY